MKIENINISDHQLDRNIYRIIPFDRFMEILDHGMNVLVRPILWDDPFENLLTYPSQNKKTMVHEDEKYFIYAQCWSFSNENDLLWRTYSQLSDGVRITSTPRKLLQSIKKSQIIKKIESEPHKIWQDEYNGNVLNEDISVFFGKVEYLTYDQISSLLIDIITRGDLKSYFETLLIKREAFRNEEEFRIGIRHFFAYEDFILESSDNIFKYDLNINDIFEEVVFDPRISDYKFEGLKHQIKKLGFQNPILKSNLYDKPKIDEIINKNSA